MADGVHQVRLAHSDAAVEEERVVGARRPLCDGQRSGAGKLVAVADDEGVEGVSRIELRGGGPVELPAAAHGGTRVRAAGARGGVRRHRAKATIFAHRRQSDGSSSAVTKDTSSNSKRQIDGFLNQVAVFVADVLKLWRGTRTKSMRPLAWL